MHLYPACEGLFLAEVLLAKRAPNKTLLIEEDTLRTLLSIAQGKHIPDSTLRYIMRASELFAHVSDEDLDYADYSYSCPHKIYSGNNFPAIAKLTMLLALSGFECVLTIPETA